MSHRIGYRFLSPRHSEITRRLAESAGGAFFENDGAYSILKSGIKRAKFALSSACLSLWNYIFPPAQIGVISRDAFSSLKKIHPISEFIEDSIPQPKPLHKDTGTSAPTPGRFQIRDSELKRPFEEITPNQAKRLKKEENVMLSVINSEQLTAAERESFKPIIPENKIKIPPWRKMQIQLTARQIKNEPPKNDKSRLKKEEENIKKIVITVKDSEEEILNFTKLQSCDFNNDLEKNGNIRLKKEKENIANTVKIISDDEKEIQNFIKIKSCDFKNEIVNQIPKPESTQHLQINLEREAAIIKTFKEEAKQESVEIKPFKEENRQMLAEMIREDTKPITLENIQEEKEKSSEESSTRSKSQNDEEPSSPAMSFGAQSQDLSAVSPTPKKLNDSNSFSVKSDKELEKINENEEKEKAEMESVKTEDSTPKFDKDGNIKDSDKKAAENHGKPEFFIKNDSILNPFRSKNDEAGKNTPITNLFKMPEQTNKILEVDKSGLKIEEDKGQLPKFNLLSAASSNPFLSESFLSSSPSVVNSNGEKNYTKPLFVFGGQSNSSSINPFSKTSSAANSFNTGINPYQSLTATSASSSIEYSQPMPINNALSINSSSASLPHLFGASASAPQISSSKPFKSSFHQTSSISDPLIKNIQYPTIPPITYQPQSLLAGSNQQAKPNFPISNFDINMSGVAKASQEIKNPFDKPFPQNTSQGTFNLGAFPDRKFLRAKRPEQK